jgi:hypothetical protein
MSEGQRYCTACGSPTAPGNAFCGQCGKPVDGRTAGPVVAGGVAAPANPVAPPAAGAPVAAPATTASGEQILGIIPNLQRKRGMFAYDAVVLVVTTQRLILAVLTADMLKQAAADATREAREQGKGFLATTWATMTSGMSYHRRYFEMTPDRILAENRQNSMIPLAQVINVRFRNRTGANDPDDLILNCTGGRVTLTQRNLNIRETRALLGRVVRDVR